MKMTEDDILAFAVSEGYKGFVQLPDWKGYQVFEPLLNSADEDEVSYVGYPLVILVDSEKNEIRMSTPDEALENLDYMISLGFD